MTRYIQHATIDRTKRERWGDPLLTYVRTSLFDSPAQTLVNTVNIVGVMGKGIALEFKQRYPDMFKAYKKLCDSHSLDVGKLHLWRAPEHWILNFPTKTTWRQPSKLEYIEAGLEAFVRSYKQMGIASVSFPPLGCGNGNLDWRDVRPVMERYLSKIDIPVYIHDRQVPQSFVAEHHRWEEKRVPISFNEFRHDIMSKIERSSNFSTLKRTSEFIARWVDDGDIVIEKSTGRTEVIDHELVEAAWSSLQNGMLTGEQFGDEPSKKLKSYLFPILASLSYVKVAEISKPGWLEGNPGHALYISREDRRSSPQHDAVANGFGEQACLSL
ncbi:macro domain-containing protein [Agrobacterium deltaense]|uniref:macro domain-containing protein n=1 Tax=Agrobacterium deltaense TaxID=1183412 RepID=UPI001CB7A1B0|nr:macro domain-containing protein [Agrobacterium deltaense]